MFCVLIKAPEENGGRGHECEMVLLFELMHEKEPGTFQNQDIPLSKVLSLIRCTAH